MCTSAPAHSSFLRNASTTPVSAAFTISRKLRTCPTITNVFQRDPRSISSWATWNALADVLKRPFRRRPAEVQADDGQFLAGALQHQCIGVERIQDARR